MGRIKTNNYSIGAFRSIWAAIERALFGRVDVYHVPGALLIGALRRGKGGLR